MAILQREECFIEFPPPFLCYDYEGKIIDRKGYFHGKYVWK